MRLGKRGRIDSTIFTGSMADISFLLIIFFMVTMVFSAHKGLDFAPSPPTDELPVVPDESVDVHVLADGTIEVDQKPMDLEEVLGYIGSKLEAAPGKGVILRTDGDAPYSAMIHVLDELRGAPDTAGFAINNLAIPTRSDYRKWQIYGWIGDAAGQG